MTQSLQTAQTQEPLPATKTCCGRGSRPEPLMESAMKLSITCRAIVLTCIALFVLQRSARGGAIEVPMQSSKAAAQADAFTAQADDPSAIYYNPAGLTQLHGTQMTVGAFFLQP